MSRFRQPSRVHGIPLNAAFVVFAILLLGSCTVLRQARIADREDANPAARLGTAPGSPPSASATAASKTLADSLISALDPAFSGNAALESATVYTVNITDDADDGTCDAAHCSLREAISAANADTGIDLIAFDIPGPGPHTIQPSKPLPTIAQPVVIDGTTEPDFAGTPIVELDGRYVGGGSEYGLYVTSGGTTVRGLVINRFRRYGIFLWKEDGNRIEGNYIGTDVTGSLDAGNGEAGIRIHDSAENIIGGTAPGTGNVISGNDEHGISLYSVGHLSSSLSETFIQGNLIGTDATGTVALGNDGCGVSIYGTYDVLVGGTESGAGNVISGNDSCGIGVTDGTRHYIRGNVIGTDSSGTLDLGNGTDGIYIFASGIIVGGVEDAAGNIIAYNHGDGIQIESATDTAKNGNGIRSNRIFSNGGPGIDLGEDGPTRNDVADKDEGPNDLVNFPDVLLATSDGSTTTVEGTLNSEPNTDFTLEFFANTFCDTSGFGEGETPLGTIDVSTDGEGNASFSAIFARSVPTGQAITATATKLPNNTSEFSQCAPVNAPPLAVTLIAPDGATHLPTQTYEWYGTTTASEYLLQVDGVSGNVLSEVYDAADICTFGNCSVTPPTPVSPGDYTWQVEARNAFGGTWSATLGFTAPTLTIFTVNSDDDTDDGSCDLSHCSLREAILAANALPGRDTITFDIPGSGPHTIQPGSALPTVTYPVIIDAATEPDFAGVPIVELDGTNAGPDANGLWITAGNSVVRGLVVNRFPAAGILLDGESHNTLEGNFIGTDATGTLAQGNGTYGIKINGATDNRIGGLTATSRNVISGNQIAGLYILECGVARNLIQGNLIGTDVTGTAALGISYYGIYIHGASENIVGGLVPAARNIISGNDRYGIFMGDSPDFESEGNLVQGNYIGTDITGANPLGNGWYGVDMAGVSGSNVVGGLDAGARNLISDNGNAGISLRSGTRDTLVQGNYIGTDITGTTALGNQLNGVEIDESGSNTIGGSASGAGNLISGNAETGVEMLRSGGNDVRGNYIGTDATGLAPLGNGLHGIYIELNGGNTIEGNRVAYNGGSGVVIIGLPVRNGIRGNSIHSHGGLGIDLNNDGVTPNDIGDGDIGPNSLQNYPVLTLAVAGSARVEGFLVSTANTEFDIEFYANAACDPSGYGEGETYLGSDTVTTNDDGAVYFSVDLAVDILAGQYITATASDPIGSTSEFSNCREVVPPETVPTASILSPVDGATVSETVSIQVDADDNEDAPGTLSVEVKIDGGIWRSTVWDGNTYNYAWNTLSSANGDYLIEARATDSHTNFSYATPITVSLDNPALTYLVNTTSDSNDGTCDTTHCSLREAIEAANARGTKDTITFDIPGPGPHTIRPNASLPALTKPVIIDGASEPDFAGTPIIEIDGSTYQSSAGGLVITGGDSAIRGLVINRFKGDGLYLNSDENVVQGNYLGTDVTGTVALGNGDSGLHIKSGANNLIGGTTSGSGNLISGNGRFGISLDDRVYGVNTRDNVIVGNLIGTDVTGTSALGNAIGIDITYAADNQIGGPTPQERNVISGNTAMGIYFYGGDSHGNHVEGNYIGVDITGQLPLGNGDNGIEIKSCTGNIIGGTVPGSGNVISANLGHGIELDESSELASTEIKGNFIGTDASGTLNLGNGIDGVYIYGARYSQIGGSEPAAGNVIAYNGDDGIHIFSGTAIQNTFSSNSIHDNGDLGIVFGNADAGVTPNDPGDPDEGPNNLQNYPELTVVTHSSQSASIQGTLNSRPNLTYRVELFASRACDPSGFGEGESYLGFETVSTNEFGNTAFAVDYLVQIAEGSFITATATDPDGNTSEFSACQPAYGPPPMVTNVGTVADTGDGSLDEGETTSAHITQLLVTFSEEVQAGTGPDGAENPANYSLVADPGGTATPISIDAASYDPGTRTVTLDLNNGTRLPSGNYRLTVVGSTSIKDLAGVPLDGNGDGVGGDDFVRDFTVDLACYTLTMDADPAAGGSISAEPAPDCNGGTGYSDGTVVELTALPSPDYTFDGWSGDAGGTDNPLNVTVDADKAVTAEFVAEEVCYTLTAIPSEGGSISAEPAPDCNGGTQYTAGTVAELTATPDEHYTFDSWSGDAGGTDNPVSVTMDGDKGITANFQQNCYTLATTVSPAGGGTLDIAPSPDCNGGTGYSPSTQVTLTASENEGYRFRNWSGDASGSDPTAIIAMDGDKAVTAHYDILPIESQMPIGDVQIDVSGTGPYAVEIHIEGSLPNTCTRLDRVEQSRSGADVTVDVIMLRRGNVACAQKAIPVSRDVVLEGEFLSGDYTLTLNGEVNNFSLP